MRIFAIVALALASTMAAGDARVDALIQMLSGEFNNNEQVWQQGLDGVTPYPREHIAFAKDQDSVVSISVDEGFTATDADWTMTIALNSQGLYGTIAEAEGVATDCVYRWKRHSDGYLGSVQNRKDCATELPDTILVNTGYLVTTRASGRSERVVQFRRVNHYRGWISLKRQHIDPEAGDDDYIFLQGLRVHDEGFIARVLDDGEPTGYAVELARLTYQRTQIPILKIGIIDEVTGKTVSYAWADQGAERIGINLRWIQGGFTLEE